jgi:thioredoxin-related protein
MNRALVLLLLIFALALPALSQDSAYVPARDYDPHRDPARDLQAAIAEAHHSDRNILLDVGGHWCKWCHYMDKFFDDHADLRELREKNFVVVYVNYGDDNKNDKFLAQFPKIAGCPHLFVLNADGKLVHSQDTSELEDGKSSYVPEKFRVFLTHYGPGKN